jgi:rod shape-determining protein MreD
MSKFSENSYFQYFVNFFPVILLFVSVLNEFDFNYLELKYFSFNFPFILIFYWSLKRAESLGYGYIFVAGLINDVVVGLPMGISSFTYLLICGFSSYLRTITLRPNVFKDWLFFLFTILVINSLTYSILVLFFSLNLNFINLLLNLFFTFLFYIMFASLFDIYLKIFFGVRND